MNTVYYWKTESDRESVERFRRWAAAHKLTIWNQNAGKVPWHVYTVIGEYDKYPQRIDFYPHKEKAVWNHITVVGVGKFNRLLVDVLAASEGEGKK